jgi:uncharacterized protein (DUF3084 family)
MTACQPDVLMTSDDATVRPIAVFADGFEFHVHPGKTTSRLADDAVKRRAVLDSETCAATSSGPSAGSSARARRRRLSSSASGDPRSPRLALPG